jgi:dUTPase
MCNWYVVTFFLKNQYFLTKLFLDNDYFGPIIACIKNESQTPVTLMKGTAYVQLVPLVYFDGFVQLVQVDLKKYIEEKYLEHSHERTGGFGSTNSRKRPASPASSSILDE